MALELPKFGKKEKSAANAQKMSFDKQAHDVTEISRLASAVDRASTKTTKEYDAEKARKY